LIKHFFIATMMGLGFALTALPARAPPDYVYVQVGPPAAIYETRPPRPHAGYVWVGGYYRWYGGRYVWTHGYWANHPGAWCQGHWRYTKHHGYYWVPGYWC
jgi:hypothetical protein